VSQSRLKSTVEINTHSMVHIQPRFQRPISQVLSARKKVDQIARHEIGHMIAARAHGFKTGICSMRVMFSGGANPISHHGTSEIILIEPLPSLSDLTDYLERRIQVLYAGALAESLQEDGKVDVEYAIEELKNGGATQDFKLASELQWIIRNIKHPVESTHEEARIQAAEIQTPLWASTIQFVEKHKDLIIGFANRLACSLTHFDQLVTLSEQEIETTPAMKDFMEQYAEKKRERESETARTGEVLP
jgi:hypothetical protein